MVSSTPTNENKPTQFTDYSISPILHSSEQKYNKSSISIADEKVNVTDDLEKLPLEIVNLNKHVSDNETLPRNSKNLKDPDWIKPIYTLCTVLEGNFEISSEEFKLIYNKEENMLITSKYTFVLGKKIKTVNNTCIFNFKSKRYLKKTDRYKIFAYCAHNCKLFLIFIDNISKSDVPHKVSVFSSSYNYNHLGPKARLAKGVERKLFNKKPDL